MKQTLMATILATALIVPAGVVLAAPIKSQVSEPIYGYQLMTQAERNDYRAKMRNTSTAEQRAQLRLDQHNAMTIRAQERGVVLNKQAPVRGRDKGMEPARP